MYRISIVFSFGTTNLKVKFKMRIKNNFRTMLDDPKLYQNRHIIFVFQRKFHQFAKQKYISKTLCMGWGKKKTDKQNMPFTTK